MEIGQIRYKSRSITDRDTMEAFLKTARIGVVGIQGDEYPYSVPVNYIWHTGALYFHSMGSGKKYDLLLKERKVSFTVFEEYGTVKDKVPCHADTAYRSIMIFGTVILVKDYEESAQVLNCIVEKYMPEFYKSRISKALAENYRSSHDKKAVAVFKIIPEVLTGKENIANDSELFKQPVV